MNIKCTRKVIEKCQVDHLNKKLKINKKSVPEMKEVKEGKRFTLQTGWIIFLSQCVLVSGNVSCFIPAYDFTDQIRS